MQPIAINNPVYTLPYDVTLPVPDLVSPCDPSRSTAGDEQIYDDPRNQCALLYTQK